VGTTLIRRAEPGDCDAVAMLNRDIQQEHAEAYPHLFKPASDETLTASAFAGLLNDPAATTLVVVDDEAVTGYVLAREIERTDTPYRFAHRVLYIDQLCVVWSARRKGHGRRLMEAMKSVAMERGISHLELDTWAFNDEARRFFREQGFRDITIRMALDE
jgi:ribosomal protein S18 acetylase RimI-like enzyme